MGRFARDRQCSRGNAYVLFRLFKWDCPIYGLQMLSVDGWQRVLIALTVMVIVSVALAFLVIRYGTRIHSSCPGAGTPSAAFCPVKAGDGS
ncbi:MAG TPA: hypothetical protein VKA30_03910 [Actinomycetota bacterium]|nr:hypothetical protein [Actinomycetota bacterium]